MAYSNTVGVVIATDGKLQIIEFLATIIVMMSVIMVRQKKEAENPLRIDASFLGIGKIFLYQLEDISKFNTKV